MDCQPDYVKEEKCFLRFPAEIDISRDLKKIVKYYIIEMFLLLALIILLVCFVYFLIDDLDTRYERIIHLVHSLEVRCRPGFT